MKASKPKLSSAEWDFSDIEKSSLEHAARYEFAREVVRGQASHFSSTIDERKSHLRMKPDKRPKMPVYMGLAFLQFEDKSYLIDGEYFPQKPWKSVLKKERKTLTAKSFLPETKSCVQLFELPVVQTTRQRLNDLYSVVSWGLSSQNEEDCLAKLLFMGSADLKCSDAELTNTFLEQINLLRRGQVGAERRGRSTWKDFLKALGAYRILASGKSITEAMDFSATHSSNNQPIYQNVPEWSKGRQIVIGLIKKTRADWDLKSLNQAKPVIESRRF